MSEVPVAIHCISESIAIGLKLNHTKSEDST